MRIAVFCSASERIDPDFFEMTRAFGEWMGRRGDTLVFGGSDQGLMRCLSDAVREAGGGTLGVLPEKFEKGGKGIEGLDTMIHCANLAERKELMLQHADCAVILPGGVGTLDELFSTLADTTLGYHNVPVYIYNMKGFWQPLFELFGRMYEGGVLRKSFFDLWAKVDTLEEMTALITKPNKTETTSAEASPFRI